MVERVYENVFFYCKKFDEIGVKLYYIKILKDICFFLFIIKDDLRENYLYGFFIVFFLKIVRIYVFLGIIGKFIVVGYIKYDMEVWIEVVVRIVIAVGVREYDIV